MFAIVNARLRSEVSHAQPISVRTRPATMEPGTHHQHVVDSGVLLLDVLISIQRAEEIFVVVPTTDSHDRRMNVLQIRKDVSLFPKLIVVRVLHHLVPELDARAELLLINVARVLHPAHVEIKLVAILRAVGEWLDVVVVRSRRRPRLSKSGKERKVLREKQRAVVMIVIAVKPIRYGSLRRDRFDRRMTIDAGH